MAKYKLFLLAFLILASLATLFPPFHWQPMPIIGEYETAEPGLPQKYDFIFNDSTRQITVTDFGGEGRPFIVNRRLIVSELILEYVIAVFVALIVQLVVAKTKSLIKRRA